MRTTIPKEFKLSYKKKQLSLLRSTSASINNNKDNSEVVEQKERLTKSKTPRKIMDISNRNNLINVRN